MSTASLDGTPQLVTSSTFTTRPGAIVNMSGAVG